MIVLHCPEPAPSRRSASSQGAKMARPQACRHAQPLTARTPFYREGKQQDRPPLRHNAGKRSAQARQEPEASGIKAGWPRLGTRRGAQPTSPTAERRDAIALMVFAAGYNGYGYSGSLRHRVAQHRPQRRAFRRAVASTGESVRPARLPPLPRMADVHRRSWTASCRDVEARGHAP